MILRFLTSLFVFSPHLVFAQVDADALLKRLKNPGPQAYTCSQEEKGCTEMYDQFCKTLYSKEHLGNMDIVSGDETFKIRLGQASNGWNHANLEHQKAKLNAIKSKRVPEDFLKNLDAKYAPALEANLRTKPASKMTDDEKLDYDQKLSELSFMYNSAWEKTIHQRVSKKFPGFYSNKKNNYLLFDNLEAKKIEDQFASDFYKVLWDKNEHFLKAKKDFDETKDAYLKYLDEASELSQTDKIKFKSWISTVTLEEPGADPSNLDLNCLKSDQNAYYQSSQHKIKVCAGYFNAFQNQQFTFAHELSHAMGLSRARVTRERESELGIKTKQLILSVCSEKNRGKCPSEWAEYKSNFVSRIQKQGNSELPLKAYRGCLMLNPQVREPILYEDKTENIDYSNYIKNKADEGAASSLDFYATRNYFTSWIVKTLPPDSNTGKSEINPRQYNPCAEIIYAKESVFSVGGSAFDRTIFIAEYLCSKASDEASKMKEAIATFTSLSSAYRQDVLRFGGSLSDMVRRDFAEDTEERFADAMGAKVFAKLLQEKYPVGTKEYQVKRRNFFLSSRANFCKAPNLESEHPDLAKIEANYSSENHSMDSQRRMDFLNSPMREVLGCKKDNFNKECKL